MKSANLLTSWSKIINLIWLTNLVSSLSPQESIQTEVTINSTNYKVGEYPDLYFSQLTDHKDTESKFRQRYFVNADVYRQGGPAFLYVSGEQSASNHSVYRGLITDLAKEHGGIIYSLEHRYYGLSQPFPTLSTEYMKYLSSDYALMDLNRFALNVKNPITNLVDRTWYIIGGSYAGTLAAWARQMYPSVFRGALASSAPILAKEDFYEYDVSIRSTLGPQCSSKMRKIVEYVDEMYTNNRTSFMEMKSRLNCLNLEDDLQFLYTFYDTISSIVQYNSPRSNPNVETMCQSLTSSQDASEILTHLVETLNLYYTNSKTSCYDFSKQSELVDTNPSEYAMMRQWNYQCCTEFGFWQSAPSKFSMRSQFLTTDWFNNFFCSKDYYGNSIGPPDTAGINYRHHGLSLRTPLTIFTNGDRDPWSQLSLSSSLHSYPYRPVLTILGGSHVNDLGSPSPSDSQSLTDVRRKIQSNFRSWINTS